MSLLAKRMSAILSAIPIFRTMVETLPSRAIGSPEALTQNEKCEETLETIERERTLILDEPLPATYPTTDRTGWEFDVRNDIPKLEKKCHEALRFALEGQIAIDGQLGPKMPRKINLESNDPKHWANILREMGHRCRKIDELTKKLSNLRDAINEAVLVETDLLRLLWTTFQGGERFIKQGHFEGILKRHDANYQRRFLINEFVKKGYLQPAQLPDGVHEETWMIVADAVKAVLEGVIAGDLSAYHAELRAFEDECYAATGGRRVIGISCWDGGRSLTNLREIDARHGVTRNDPRVYSIAAYRRELEAIRGDLDNLRLQADANTDDESLQARWWRCEFRLTDCAARHFPGLNLLDGESVDSNAKLWAYIVRGVEQSELADRVAGPSVHQKTLREVYKAMHRLGLTWAPRPPYGSLPDDQVVEELWHIANRLVEKENTETSAIVSVEFQGDPAGPLPARVEPQIPQTGPPVGVTADPKPAAPPPAFDADVFLRQGIDRQKQAEENAAKKKAAFDRMEPLANAVYSFNMATRCRHESDIDRCIFQPEQLESIVRAFCTLGRALTAYYSADQLAGKLTATAGHNNKLFACQLYRHGIAGEESELWRLLERLLHLPVIEQAEIWREVGWFTEGTEGFVPDWYRLDRPPVKVELPPPPSDQAPANVEPPPPPTDQTPANVEPPAASIAPTPVVTAETPPTGTTDVSLPVAPTAPDPVATETPAQTLPTGTTDVALPVAPTALVPVTTPETPAQTPPTGTTDVALSPAPPTPAPVATVETPAQTPPTGTTDVALSPAPPAPAPVATVERPEAPGGWTEHPASLTEWADRMDLDPRTLQRQIDKGNVIVHQVSPRKYVIAIHTLPPQLKVKHQKR